MKKYRIFHGVKLHEVLPEAQTLYEQGNYERAHQLLETYANENPPHYRVWRALGVIKMRLGEPEQALRYYQAALCLQPNDPEIRFSLSQYYLSQGDYEQGFEAYEARMEFGLSVATLYTQRAPFWDGRLLKEEPLLLHCEQGFGDTLQFIRLLPRVLDRVKTLYLACHRELFSLFANLPGVTRVITEDHEIPSYGFQLPLMSLGRVFHIRKETIPRRVPYLFVPPIPFVPRPQPRVGLVWRAKPPNGGYKSVSLTDLLPLAGLPVTWVVLQKGVEAEEAEFLRREFRIEDPTPPLVHFRETAERMQTLDLILTVDTAAAHLAGALALPTWVMLPKWSDWRWVSDRNSNRDITPWYPTMTLFRQQTERDWRGQIGLVKERLAELCRDWKWEDDVTFRFG